MKKVITINDLAIMVAKGFEGVDNNLYQVRKDISGLSQDVSGLKQDVSIIKQDIFELKEDVSYVKEDISKLKQDVSKIESKLVPCYEFNRLAVRVSDIEKKQKENN